MASNVPAKREENPIAVGLQGEDMRAKLEAALPSHLPVERLLRVTMVALQKTPKLLQCDKLTIYKAVMESAQLGLVPDGILGEAYFVPYGKQCQLIVGYRGLQALAFRTGKVSSILADVVCENDDFDFEQGLQPRLRHVPAEKDRGDVIRAYAVAHMVAEGPPAFIVMNREEIDAIRAKSKAGRSGPWNDYFAEMAKKTAIRRLCKNLPLSPDLVAAAAKGEYYDAGVLSGGVSGLKPGKFGFDGAPKHVEVEDGPSDVDSMGANPEDQLPSDAAIPDFPPHAGE